MADCVVIASPWEFTGIEWVNMTAVSARVRPRTFVHWYVTVVRAYSLNASFFGLPNQGAAMPNAILTTAAAAADTPFNVIQLEATISAGDKLFKIFSNEDVRPHLPRLFTDVTSVDVQVWPYTFPELKPVKPISDDNSADADDSSDGYQPIVPARGIFYLNAMESVASAMEGSVIAGRNVAQLLSEFSP